MLVYLYKEAVVLPVASKYCEDFVECLNEIYTHLSVQYHDIRTLKCAYISLTFQSQVQYDIYTLAIPFDLRCESVTYIYIACMFENYNKKKTRLAIYSYLSNL